MNELWPWALTGAVLAAILAAPAWFAARIRRSGASLDVMGPVDAIYRPHTHQITVELRVREERLAASPAAAGEPKADLGDPAQDR